MAVSPRRRPLRTARAAPTGRAATSRSRLLSRSEPPPRLSGLQTGRDHRGSVQLAQTTNRCGRRGRAMWYWLFKYIFMGPLFTLLGRPKVEGLDNIPSSGPAILASNHL